MSLIKSDNPVLTYYYKDSGNPLNENSLLNVIQSVNHQVKMDSPSSKQIRTYSKRFLILALFCLCSSQNAFQWLQYAIITSKVADYYQVSDILVNITSIIYMIIFIPGMFPAAWLMSKKGLRSSLLIASFVTLLGAVIKCGSLHRDRFWVTMIGQVIAAIGNVFVLSVPPRLAAVWFGENEISTATSIGVFGNQLGICASFFLPPWIVRSTSISGIEEELRLIFYGSALFMLVLFALIVLLFDNQPPSPPSRSSAKARIDQESSSFCKSLVFLVSDSNMQLLTLSYGLNVGAFYAISTVLDQIISSAFPGHNQAAGNIGAIITISGTVGASLCGIILDRTKKYKETTLVLYIFSLLGLISFIFALKFSLFLSHIVAALMGFFMNGYLPIGFEYAAELTYPEPEGNSAGILNLSAQVSVLFEA